MRWQHLSRIFDRRGEAISRHGWFHTDARGVVLRVQQGVVRTNCMDNLDRTNVVQSVLGRCVSSVRPSVRPSISSVIST